jgi:2-hydroxychromene-2-carboxylate isomerase
MSPPLTVDVYYSFRSPYSYLAAPRLASWPRKYNIKVNLRPVLPLVVRTPEFFEKIHPLFSPYLYEIDTPREASFLGLPFQVSNPDPVVVHVDQDGILRMGNEQPYIYRLTYLGVLAEERGRGMEFAEQVSGIIWTTNDWHKGSHLADATRRAGLDLAELDGVIDQEEARLKAIVDANQGALAKAGHWGVPTCVFDGEPFFGQDRLDTLLWRLEQKGLKEISAHRSEENSSL